MFNSLRPAAAPHASLSLGLLLFSGMAICVLGLSAWVFDSWIWAQLEKVAEVDPWILSSAVKLAIQKAASVNTLFLIGAGLLFLGSLAYRLRLPGGREALMLLLGIGMVVMLGFPVWEWGLIDSTLSSMIEAETGDFAGFSARYRGLKIVSAILSVGLACACALAINRLTQPVRTTKLRQLGHKRTWPS